jgi:hypothetical protein
MKLVLVAGLLMTLLAPQAISAQAVTCPPRAACEVANTIIEYVLDRAGDLRGRTVFIDRVSFLQAGDVLRARIMPVEVGVGIATPFRSDVAVTALHAPAPGHNSRWGADPYLIQLDSITGDADRLTAYIQLRFNVRKPEFPDATAVTADFRKGAIYLERRNGHWVVVSSRVISGG